MNAPTLAEQINAVDQVGKMRARDYRYMVAIGKMAQQKADQEQAAIQAALLTLRAVEKLVPLLRDGWDEYDDTEYCEAGNSALEALIMAANVPLNIYNQQKNLL